MNLSFMKRFKNLNTTGYNSILLIVMLIVRYKKITTYYNNYK
jgi:hypothetical protein